MYEVIGANKKTGQRFSHWFDRPAMAMRMKIALQHSPTADYIALWKH